MQRRSFLLGAGAVALGTTVPVLTPQQASAARQHSFLHGVSSQVTNILVKYGWNGGGDHDFVPRGQYATIDVGSVYVPAGYSLWLDTRPGSGTTWTRWAAKSTKSRYISMASMPVTRSQFVLRHGNKWGTG